MLRIRNSILESDVIHLHTARFSRKFRIHKDLLAAKCKVIHAAHAKEFKEKADGTYIIQHTRDEMIVRFIE